MNTRFFFITEKRLKPSEAGCGRTLSFLCIPQLSSLCKRPFNQDPKRPLFEMTRGNGLPAQPLSPAEPVAVGKQFPKPLQLQAFLCKETPMLRSDLMMEKGQRTRCAGKRGHIRLSHHFFCVRSLHGWEMEREMDGLHNPFPTPAVLAESNKVVFLPGHKLVQQGLIQTHTFGCWNLLGCQRGQEPEDQVTQPPPPPPK